LNGRKSFLLIKLYYLTLLSDKSNVYSFFAYLLFAEQIGDLSL